MMTTQNATAEFNVNLAIKLGNVGLAILCEYFATQIAIHQKDGENEEDGHTWHPISKSALVKLYPFWTESQIRTKLDKLIAKGVLMCKSEEGSFSRVNRYAFVDEAEFVRGGAL